MTPTSLHNGRFQPEKKRDIEHTPHTETDGPLSGQVKTIRKLRAQGKSEAEVQAVLGVPQLAGEDEPRPQRKARQETPHAEEPEMLFSTLKDLFNTPNVKVDWLVDGSP